MDTSIKKWINRSGLIMVAIGVTSYLLTGGDAGTAGNVVTSVSGIVGALLVLTRELMG